MNPKSIAISVTLALATCIFPLFKAQGSVGDSQVANWKDNKTAAFLVMFDDSCHSHFQVAIPELLKRNMIATFYVNPGHSNWKTAAKQWETILPKTGMAYADHTWSHTGFKGLEQADFQFGECQRKIYGIFYNDNKPHLISFGAPGVGPGMWDISKEDTQTLLDRYTLINRPPFDFVHGVVVGPNTVPACLALADKAIAGKGMEYLIIHGVERRPIEGDPDWKYQDFWAFNKDTFRGVLDGLVTRRENGDLWITDHISQHKYQKERDNKPVFQVQKATTQMVQLKMTGTLDPGLYDAPLTVITQVPATWLGAVVTQGTQSVVVPVVNGSIQYDAFPNGTPITAVPTALPVVTVKATTPDAAELGAIPGVFKISKTGGVKGVVNYTITTGSAMLPSQNPRCNIAASPVLLPPGASSAAVNVVPVPDDVFEGVQTVTMTITPGNGYTVGSSGSSAMVLIHDKPFEQWKYSQFGTRANDTSVSGDLVDTNGAQITNILAYGLGVNPNKLPDPAKLPQTTTKAYGGAQYLSLTFTRNINAKDVTYTVEVNADPTHPDKWTPVAKSVNGAVTSGPGFVQESGTTSLVTVETRDVAPVNPAVKRAIRLTVTR